jgi:hypothetical protein
MGNRVEGFIQICLSVLVLACSSRSGQSPGAVGGRAGESTSLSGGVLGQGGGQASGGDSGSGGGPSTGGNTGVNDGSGGRVASGGTVGYPGSGGSGGNSGSDGTGGHPGSGGSGGDSGSGGGPSAGGSTVVDGGRNSGSGGSAGHPGSGGSGGGPAPLHDSGTTADAFAAGSWPFPACTAGNCDDVTGSNAGTCGPNNTCQCASGFGIDASTGRCARITLDAAFVCGNSVSDCNDTPAISALAGVCLMNGTCYCLGDAVLNSSTGRCRFAH